MKSVLTFDFEKMSYFPPIFFNDFWLLRDYLVPMNKSVTEVPLHFSVSGLSSIKFMLYTQAEQSFNMQVPILYSCTLLLHPHLPRECSVRVVQLWSEPRPCSVYLNRETLAKIARSVMAVR